MNFIRRATLLNAAFANIKSVRPCVRLEPVTFISHAYTVQDIEYRVIKSYTGFRLVRKSVNQSINLYLPMQLQANNKKVWHAARTGNNPTKLVTLDRKTDR